MNDNPSQKDTPPDQQDHEQRLRFAAALAHAATHVRAQLWAQFAAAAMGNGDASENTALAAKAADRMLGEHDKRFPEPTDGDR